MRGIVIFVKETFKIFFCLIHDLMAAKEISRDYQSISKAHLSINKIFILFSFSHFCFQPQEAISMVSNPLRAPNGGQEGRVQVIERLPWDRGKEKV